MSKSTPMAEFSLAAITKPELRSLILECWAISRWTGPTGGILDYTKFIYESIDKFCPNVHTVNTNSHLQRNEFFPYPMLGGWKNSKITKYRLESFFFKIGRE